MFESSILKHLKNDEEPVRIVRKYWITLVGPLSVSALCSIAPFFFLVPLFRLGSLGVAFFVILAVTGLLIFFRSLYVYSLNAFLITNKRIIDIDQHGFFRKTVSESSYQSIQDVSVRFHGIFQTVFHYGSILIQTAGSTANLEIFDAKNPEAVQDIVGNLIEASRRINNEKEPTGTDLSASELLHLAEKLKEGMTPDQFRKIIGKNSKNND